MSRRFAIRSLWVLGAVLGVTQLAHAANDRKEELRDALRISIGTDEEIDALVQALDELLVKAC